MRNKRKVMHPGQIPTNLKTIKTELLMQGHKAIFSLFKCLISEPNSFSQKNQIIYTATLFERLSCLVYFGKNGYYQKPTVSKYYEEIFEGFAETPEEVFYRIERYGVTREQSDHIYKLVWQVADLVCPMMACEVEQAFIHEYAYVIEYVINHNCDLPKPEFFEIFPTNYEDYHPKEGFTAAIRYY